MALITKESYSNMDATVPLLYGTDFGDKKRPLQARIQPRKKPSWLSQSLQTIRLWLERLGWLLSRMREQLYQIMMDVYASLPLPVDRPSFRLLELDPSRDEEQPTVHATMRNFVFANAPEYEALSYTWGAQESTEMIKLNGHDFPVTSNLLAALQQIRRNQAENPKSKRMLWIDAICINQSDNAEKSRHVMWMKEIYTKASRVLVWAGDATKCSELAFDTFQRFASNDTSPNGTAAHHVPSDAVGERRAAVQSFLQRSYWTRVWVIQEVVVASNVTILCGPLGLSFDQLYAAVERMTGSAFIPLTALSTNVTYLGDWRLHFHKNALPGNDDGIDLRFFMDSRDRQATDPRDKIYAVRGLITNIEFAAGIEVDYNKSTEKIYTDFSKHLLSTAPDLRVLSTVMLRHRQNPTLDLPSWVPDWSQPKHGGGILQRYYRFAPEHLFRAAGSSTARVQVRKNSNTISAQGVLVDTVERVIPTKSILTAHNHQQEESQHRISVNESVLRALSSDLSPSDTYPFTNEPCWRAFFRTLTADRSALSPRIHSDYRAKFLRGFGTWKLNDRDADIPQNLPEDAWAEISKGIYSIIEDKDMFVTTRGYLGLSQEGFRVGDVVAVLCGGEVPFMLRPVARSVAETFEFLSECYVHGVMDGEAMKETEKCSLRSFMLE